MKQIRHAVNEDPLRTGPLERLKKLSRHKTDVNSLLKRVARDATKPLGEGLGMAVSTTRTDF
jgi:hypothetical protein